jgi:hypothetical protein
MNYTDSQGRSRQLNELAMDLTIAKLKLVDLDDFDDGRLVQLSTGNFYRYMRSSALTGDDQLVIKPTGSKGRWLLAPNFPFDLALPIDFNVADAAALLTLPAGCYLALGRSYWKITADWTGGSSSAIGLSGSVAPHSTKGDLLGGAGGDVAATLVAAGGKLLGTVGADVAGGILLKPTHAVRFDRITSAFTAGTGFAHLVGRCIANAGS